MKLDSASVRLSSWSNWDETQLFEIWRDGEQLEAKASAKDNQVFLEQRPETVLQVLHPGGDPRQCWFRSFMQLPSAGREVR